MKATPAVLVVLAAIFAATAHASPIVYGAQTPIIEEELRELQPQAAMPGDVSVYTEDGQAVGFRAADNLRVTAFHGLALKLSATTLNLRNEETHRVYFGFPGTIDQGTFNAWSERTDTVRKLREARKADLGTWVLGFPVGGNRWECWVPSSILNLNQTTQVIIKLEGKFNHKRTKILWLITIGKDKRGTYEERLEIACVEPPAALSEMSREMVFAHLIGFAPAWAAQVVSPNIGGLMGGEPAPGPLTRSELDQTLSDFRASVLSDVRQIIKEELGAKSTTATPTETYIEPAAEAEPQTGVYIRPLGGFEVRGDTYIISRGQVVYAVFDQPVPEGCYAQAQLFCAATNAWGPETVIAVKDGMHAFHFDRVPAGQYRLEVRVVDGNANELCFDSRDLVLEGA